MEQTLEKVINEHENGLFLLDSPTGFGKTSAVLNLIKEFLRGEKFADIDRMFFVTNLKTNLPYERLLSELTLEEKKQCVWVKAYEDDVIDNWDTVTIPDDAIRNSKEAKALKADIVILNDLINDKKELDGSGKINATKQISINNLRDKIKYTTERDFRKMIREKVFAGQSLYDKKKYIKNNEWFRKLYPICEMENKKVIFMTTAKFFSPINLFYRMPFYMYDDAILKHSVVFMDEFDASKKDVLSRLIESSLKQKIDIISLFTSIYYVLKNQAFPAELLADEVNNEENTIEDGEETIRYSSKEILDLNRNKFEEIYNKYHVELFLKSRGFNNNEAFLFDDGNYITVFSDNQRKHLKVQVDQESVTNVLTAERKKPTDDNLLRLMLNAVYSCITYFAHGVKFLSNNYLRAINAKRVGYDHQYTSDEALMTILNAFNLKGENREYLYSILSDGRMKISFDERFSRKGFKFIEIEDSEYHSLQTIAHQYNFETTPENLIIMLAERTRLIGISATASVDTVVGNYDLNYIKNVLGEKYIQIEDKDEERIASEFSETQKIYNKIKIKVDLIDDLPCFDYDGKTLALFKKVFKYDSLDYNLNILNECSDSYYKHVISKLVYLYKEVGQSNIKSFICFLNKLPGYDDKKLNTLLINRLFENAAKDAGFEKFPYFVVTSSNYDDKMSEIYANLKNGGKCFVITTYQTIGSGKNIQYDISDCDTDSIIVQDKEYYQKDFDGIYLQTPTNLIQQLDINSLNKHEDLMRYLYQQQTLYLNKKLILGQYRLNVLNGFRRCFFNDYTNSLFSRNSDLCKHTAQYIIQAVGRICRCRNKNKNIYIYSDIEVVERLQRIKDYLDNRIFNSEFKALLNTHIKNERALTVEDYSKLSQRASAIIFKTSCTVRSSPAKVREWEELRDFVLTNPTANNVPDRYAQFYFKFDSEQSGYSYKPADKSFKIIDIKLNRYEDMTQVSEQDCELPRMLETPCIQELFKEKHYARKWAYGKYVMSPSLYNQVYKGALGEVVGKRLLEEFTGNNVLPIEDYSLYELFDFKVNNVYVDFKHWKTFRDSPKKQIEKVKWKLNRSKGEKAVIINIVKRGEHKSFKNIDEDVIEIPYLIDENNEVSLEMIGILENIF